MAEKEKPLANTERTELTVLRMKYKYTISVIMPIYNVEKYLREAIESIISQSIGFTENIQLILVNDGSTDNSADICRYYENTYSDNVLYIEKENGGVSSARNAGIAHIEGKYTNFMDADDVWDAKALRRAVSFLEKNESIDVAACRLKFFEAKKGYTKNDFRFREGNRIVDIMLEPTSVQLGVCSAVFRTEAINGLAFDERLEIGEDAKFINTVILKKEKYGVLKTAVYNVRRRENHTSATQTKRYSITRLTNTVDYYLNYFCDVSEEMYGHIIPYIQYMVMNSVRNRTIDQLPVEYTDEFKKTYAGRLFSIVEKMDDEILAGISHTPYNNRLFLLKIKYGDDMEKHISLKGGELFFNDFLITKLTEQKLVIIDEFRFNKNMTEVRGVLNGSLYYDASLSCNGVTAELKEADDLAKLTVDGKPIDRKYRFLLTIPAGDQDIVLEDKDNGIIPIRYRFSDESFLTKDVINSLDNGMFVYANRSGIHIRKSNIINRLRFNKEMKQQKP